MTIAPSMNAVSRFAIGRLRACAAALALASIIASTIGLATPAAAHDWQWTSSDQYGTCKDSVKAEISNGVWGANDGWKQTIYVYSHCDWEVKSNLKAQQYIGSYPRASVKIGKPVNDVANAAQPLMTVFSVTTDRSGVFDHAYDIWADGEQYEVMIWNDWGGGLKPIASSYDGSGPVPTWRDANIGGRMYNVYTGKGGSGPYCISFLPTGGIPVNNVTLNISEFLKWISAKNYWSNPTLTSVQLGWEICDTYGREMTFTVNDFEVYQGTRPPLPPPFPPAPEPVYPMHLNVGGDELGAFWADWYSFGGSTSSTVATIDLSALPAPVPAMAVLQDDRWGVFTYTFTKLTPGADADVNLYFVETYYQASGKRQFNVAINGATALTNFDIFASAGSKNKAVFKTFKTKVDAAGKILLSFEKGAADMPSVAAIEVISGPPTVAVAVAPAIKSLLPSGSADFTATVTNATNPAVTWKIDEGDGVGGSVSALGHYVAPATQGVYHVRATSVEDTTKSAVATVTVAPVTVTVAPASTTLATGASTTFTATVTSTDNTAVTWKVDELTGGSVSTTGVYTAPAIEGSFHVRATSVADTTKSATGIAVVTKTPAPPDLFICTGGPATDKFVADVYFSGGTVATKATATMDTSLLTAVIPQTVLQSERYGPMTYTIPGYIAGQSYTVTMYFVETWWTAANLRAFNVAINGNQVLTNFDIFATAGNAKNKAVEKSFAATADASGKITIAFSNGSADQPRINGLAITSAGTPPVTRIPLYIDVGGAGTGDYIADAYFTGGTAASTTAAINTSALAMTVPLAALQSERWGPMIYTVPNINAGAYNVSLFFTEGYCTGAGQRQFNAKINGSPVLTNFDIFAAAGTMNKAVQKDFVAMVGADGKLVIEFAIGAANNPKIDAIAITVAGHPPTITAIPNQTILVNTATGALPFFINDVDTPAANLTLLASSSNPTLIPPANIVFGGSGANRTVTVTPAAGQVGTATVGVQVKNTAGASSSVQFTVTVQLAPPLPILDRNGDGISDVWAALYPTAGGPAADPDGDGQNNLAEAQAGTDPLRGASCFSATTTRDASGNIIVRWFGVAGKHYYIEASTDMHNWTELAADYLGSGAEISANVRPAGTADTRSFWRVVVFDVDSTASGLNDWEKTHMDMVATVGATAGANGGISPAGSQYVAKGGSLTFTITPASGYVIDAVLVNGVSVGAVSTYTFANLQASPSISASFKLSNTPDWSRPESITANWMVHYLGRGINLGNTYELGLQAKDFNSVKRVVDAYIAAGFAHVRIPVSWGNRSDGSGNVGIDANGNPTDGDIRVLKQLVEYLTKQVNPQRILQGKQPILVMIDTHHEEWAMNDLLGSGNYENNIRRLETIWRGICTIFRDQPDTLLFELFNEPHLNMNVANAVDTVVDMNKRMYAVIRNFTTADGKKPHQYRKLVFGGINYNSTWGLYYTYSSQDRLPGGGSDRYILGTYHFYNPIGTAGEEYDKVRNQFQQAFNVPVIMGEYGTDHRNGVQQTDRDYYRNAGNWGVARGFAVTAWDDNGWFRVFDRGSNTWAVPLSDLFGDGSVPPAPSTP